MWEFDYGMIGAFVVGILFLYFIIRTFAMPLKFMFKMIINALLGGLALLVINFAGKPFDFQIGLNFLTVFLAGFLGIPGVALLIILTRLFVGA